MEDNTMPDKIDIIIPIQKYDDKVYSNSKECYIAKSLIEQGFLTPMVFSDGECLIWDSSERIHRYKTTRKADKRFFKEELAKGKDINLTLVKRN